jgi:hypothetical protein
MIRRRKLIEIRSESPASGARFVGQPCFARLAHLQKDDSFVPEKYW